MPHMRRILTVILLGCSAVCLADTTVTTLTVITDSGGPPNVQNPTLLRTTYYRRGAMRRRNTLSDKGAPSFSSLANCQSRTGFLIDLHAREYETFKVVTFLTEAQRHEYLLKNPQSVVQVESRTVDTGERKVFFGYAAKHLITTNKRPPDKNSGGGEEIIDGWYIDHESGDNNCAPEYVRSDPYYVLATALVMLAGVPQFQHNGPMPVGLAVKSTRTVRIVGAKNGGATRTIKSEVTVEELSDSPLSPSLFELPAGLHENQRLLPNPVSP